MKIKLKYPKYTFNRSGNVNGHVGLGDAIRGVIRIQELRVNDYLPIDMRPEFLKPGAWTLHFDGEDFWFEGTKKQLSLFELEDYE